MGLLHLIIFIILLHIHYQKNVPKHINKASLPPNLTDCIAVSFSCALLWQVVSLEKRRSGNEWLLTMLNSFVIVHANSPCNHVCLLFEHYKVKDSGRKLLLIYFYKYELGKTVSQRIWWQQQVALG